MLEKEKLRKADVYSGIVIFLFGAWIVWQASKMPMKDSWGGVQNVWFVSPALLPLFIGAMIMLLGLLLFRTALKTIGMKAFGDTLRWVFSKNLLQFLNTVSILRFYAIAVLFLAFVFLNIPRIDFFLSATAFFIIYFAVGLDGLLNPVLPFTKDILALGFILGYCFYAWRLVRSSPLLRKKYRTGLIVAVVAPVLVGLIFKYFLLVPMPAEGMVVALVDAIWYFEF
jgi:hypothetical protein